MSAGGLSQGVTQQQTEVTLSQGGNHQSNLLFQTGQRLVRTSARGITKPVVCARIVLEMGSHLTKMVSVQSHNSFLDQSREKSCVIELWSRKELCD